MLCSALAILVLGCHDRYLPVIPALAEVSFEGGYGNLDAESRVVVGSELKALAESVAEDLSAITGVEIKWSNRTSQAVDLVFELTNGEGEGYSITMDEDVTVQGGSISALALGATTFLQLLDGAVFDRVEIHDRPSTDFRALMVDVARNYHSIETLKKLIEVCRFSKVRYMQLHLTDDQNWMFPSDVLGDLSSYNSHKRPSYTKEEIAELNEYARLRGVKLIPEIDVPGHSSILVRAKPELFKIANANLGGCIDFASLEARRTIRKLLDEVTCLFPYSRYIHFGGDEAYYHGAENDLDFVAAMEGLGYEPSARYLGEVFRDFLRYMSEHIVSRGRTPLVWEGFGSSLNSKVALPDELIVVSWNGAYHPQRMIDDGLTIINACWDPLYVVDHYPRDNFTYAAPKRVYGFKTTHFQTYFRGFPISDGVKLEPTDKIVGAMMCWWEGREENALPMLTERMAAFGARLWSPSKEENWSSFALRYPEWKAMLEKIIGPIRKFERKGEVVESLTTGAKVRTDADIYPNHPPSLVVDGKLSERLDYWMAYPPGRDLVIDMGVLQSVDRINVVAFWDGGAYSRYVLLTGADGTTWNEVADMSENNEPATKDGYMHTFEQRDARYVMLRSLGSSKVPGTMARIIEVQAFGPMGCGRPS